MVRIADAEGPATSAAEVTDLSFGAKARSPSPLKSLLFISFPGASEPPLRPAQTRR
jgi:hypothetical protein